MITIWYSIYQLNQLVLKLLSISYPESALPFSLDELMSPFKTTAEVLTILGALLIWFFNRQKVRKHFV